MSSFRRSLLSIAIPWLGLVFGIFVACFLALFFKEQPLHVLKVLATSFTASKFDLGLTLFYTTCLIFSGLAFTIPMKAGLFHIGSEGQILFSALVGAYLGSVLQPIDHAVSVPVTFITIVAMTLAAGALCGLVIAFLKTFRGAHEVVVAIMLNFILAAITTWATVHKLQNPNSQNPETSLINEKLKFFENDFLKLYFEKSQVSSFLILAVLSSVLFFVLENYTHWGYRIRAVGKNPKAATRIGIQQNRILFQSLALAGAFSALVGMTEVFGNTFQFKIGFSPQYGFLGIAVALLARQHFLGIIFSAFLVACLHKGASDLDLETQNMTRDFSLVLQSIIIISVAASYYLLNSFQKRRG